MLLQNLNINEPLINGTEIYIITHSNCHDGAASAWVIDNYFRNKMERDNRTYKIVHHRISPSYVDRFIKTQTQFHSTETEQVKLNRLVYSADLSYSGEDMAKIIQLYPQIVIIDHHISSFRSVLSYYYSLYLFQNNNIDIVGNYIDEYNAKCILNYINELKGNLSKGSELWDYLPACYMFDNDESGATLTFKYFYGHFEPPMVIQYIKDRDIWKFSLPNSFIITLGIYEVLSNMPPDNNWKIWDDYIANETVNLIEAEKIGKIISNLTNKRVKHLAEKASRFTINMNGIIYVGAHVNTTENVSDLGNYIVNIKSQNNNGREYEYDFALIWQYDSYEHVFNCSLRSRSWKDPNDNNRLITSCEVDKLAGCFGGGGHSAASGFKINNLFEIINKPISHNSSEISTLIQHMITTNLSN